MRLALAACVLSAAALDVLAAGEVYDDREVFERLGDTCARLRQHLPDGVALDKNPTAFGAATLIKELNALRALRSGNASILRQRDQPDAIVGYRRDLASKLDAFFEGFEAYTRAHAARLAASRSLEAHGRAYPEGC